MASMRMSATSGRVNSTGGRSPLLSISRTLVPERNTLSSGLVAAAVLPEAIAPAILSQNECSNMSGVMRISSVVKFPKISWAS